MAKRPGVYLFEAGSHEDILANDGKLAVDDFLTARRVLNSFSSLSFASDCSFFPVHYEEDLVQEERRKNFVLKDWAVAALVSDDGGKLLKALLVNLSHHDEGFLVDLRYGVILVAFSIAVSISANSRMFRCNLAPTSFPLSASPKKNMPSPVNIP